jgi:hypothetical protein
MAEQPIAHAPIDPLLTAHDLIPYGLTPIQARRWFDRRVFPTIQVRRRLYVRRSVFEAFLEANTNPARDAK